MQKQSNQQQKLSIQQVKQSQILNHQCELILQQQKIQQKPEQKQLMNQRQIKNQINTVKQGYLQQDQSNLYLKSIQQIQNILQNKQFTNNKFIQTILSKFTKNVFNSNHFNGKSLKQIDKDQQTKEDFQFIDQSLFNLQQLQNIQSNQTLFYLIRFNPIFHARIAYILYILTNKHIQFYNQLSFSDSFYDLKQQILSIKLRYTFDQFIWTQTKQLQYSYSWKNTQSTQPKIAPQLNIKQIENNQLFKKIDLFIKKLGFNNQNHPFNKKMSHLNKQSYKIRYIQQFAFYSFKSAQQIFNFLQNQKSNRFNNIKFYYNKIKASYSKLTLQQIYDKKVKDYDWLQSTHDYIQWLFPNHFQSNFNGNSFALGYVEAQIFKIDQSIRSKLIQSFLIYLDFMGCKLYQLKPQNQIIIQLGQNKQSFRRLKQCLIYHTHNHLRIMRILACLSVTGLRLYAQAFIQFLNSLKELKNFDYSCIKHPLQNNWNTYKSQTPQQRLKALQMCFTPYNSFPIIQTHISSIINKKPIEQLIQQIRTKRMNQKQQKRKEDQIQIEQQSQTVIMQSNQQSRKMQQEINNNISESHKKDNQIDKQDQFQVQQFELDTKKQEEQNLFI